MSNRFDIRGSIVALVTPLNEDGSINFNKLRELLEFQIRSGTDAILILGTTSESPTFTTEEDLEIARVTMEVCRGRIHVMASAGSNCTEYSIDRARMLEEAGVDSLLCISPYYNKANKRDLYHHFVDVADAVNIPILIYNIPGRTGINVPVDLMAELAQHPNIVGVKEATGDMSYVAKLAKATQGMDFSIWSGNDDITIPMMALGASGCISVWANLQPEKTAEMTHAFLAGDTQRATELQVDNMNLINDLFIEVNPIPIKEAMNMAGMAVGGYRLPLYPMEDANRDILRREMVNRGIIA